MRRLSKTEMKKNDCEFCEAFFNGKCKHSECLYFSSTHKRREYHKISTVFRSVKHKTPGTLKAAIYALYDDGVMISAIAERLRMRPQNVLDVIEERKNDL